MFPEDDLLPISGLQHLIFCERQWGLIHLEQVWAENRLTVEGKNLHERVDEPEVETRGNVRVTRAMSVRSLELGITGRCDVVEFHYVDAKACRSGVAPVAVVPVEYKRGKKKWDRCDEVQLCAQGLCLEEMLGVHVTRGDMFYATPRRRESIQFGANLREFTMASIRRMHELTKLGTTPRAQYEKKCDNCSLISVCMPKVTDSSRSAAEYLARSVLAAGE